MPKRRLPVTNSPHLSRIILHLSIGNLSNKKLSEIFNKDYTTVNQQLKFLKYEQYIFYKNKKISTSPVNYDKLYSDFIIRAKSHKILTKLCDQSELDKWINHMYDIDYFKHIYLQLVENIIDNSSGVLLSNIYDIMIAGLIEYIICERDDID